MKQIGSYQQGSFTEFIVWGPLCKRMVLHLVNPVDQLHEMKKDDEGYWHLLLNNVPEGTKYFYQPNGLKDFPDPASQFQPDGVHGPSQVISHKFEWSDASWQPPSFGDLVLYELHVGTFTKEGTFEAAINRLQYLAALGVNAIELMPVNQFPGNRNWGYDGVFAYAVQHSYGGPAALKKFVNACHQAGIAVFLDVVYNHMGPEGNYLSQFGPYFNKNYCTPWGDALNFDSEWSDGVRDFLAGNAIYWFENFHIDGLRCDAIHMVFDNGAIPFFEYLHQQVKQFEQATGKSYYLIAESDLNSPKVTYSPDRGGLGFDAQWLDDFHHSLYTLLDKQGAQRYEDYGSMEQLAKAYTDGFVLTGEWVKFRKRKYGRSSAGVPGNRFVVFNQNHDQVGNRVGGERLSMLVNFNRLKLAAAAVFMSPYVPMLFMGEEFGAKSPFLYFVSHSDPELIEAVRKGRLEEFKAFDKGVKQLDAQDENTFMLSKIKWDDELKDEQRLLLEWHKELISIRKRYPVMRNYSKDDTGCSVVEDKTLILSRKSGSEELRCYMNFSESITRIETGDLDVFNKILDSRDYQWSIDDGTPSTMQGYSMEIAPLSAVVLHRFFCLTYLSNPFMFLGHFGLAFAAKKIDRGPLLATTFVAAQFIDLLWPFFLIVGLEDVEIDPGNTAFTPLNFVYYPFSHSLAATFIWALVFGLFYYLAKRKSKTAILLGVLVLSHWFLDFITHRPDLPLSFGSPQKYGLGLWNNIPATIVFELLIFFVGVGLYARNTKPLNRWGIISFISLVVFFLLIYFMNVFGEPPPNKEAIGYVGLAQWLFIAWAYWCDRTRKSI